MSVTPGGVNWSKSGGSGLSRYAGRVLGGMQEAGLGDGGQGSRSSDPQPSLPGPGQRQTQPDSFYPLGGDVVYPIYRPTLLSPYDLSLRASLNIWGSTSPLRVLIPLADHDPDISLAIHNINCLICSPGDVQIVAIEPGQSSSGYSAHHPQGTARLEELFDRQPAEIGGLEGLMNQGTMLTCFSGLWPLEGVPGAPGEGLANMWPVDSFTMLFGRHAMSSAVIPYQRKYYYLPSDVPDPLPIAGYKQLNTNTFFWRAWQPWVDMPYGRALFAPAVAEVLKNITMMQDVRDFINHTAYPRGGIAIDTLQLYQVATTVMGFRDSEDDPQASNWVAQEFQKLIAVIQDLKADDWIVTGAGTPFMLNPGNASALTALLKELQLRVVRATKQLPVLMAQGMGKTETQTTVEWKIFANAMEALRSFVLHPILKACNLHLRLLGLPLVAVAKYQKIRSDDAYLEAQTEALRLNNSWLKVLMGMINPDGASMEITGRPRIAGAPPWPEVLPATGPGPAANPAAQNHSATSSEEQDGSSASSDSESE